MGKNSNNNNNQYSVLRIICWVNAISLSAGGAYTMYDQLNRGLFRERFSEVMLALYMCFLGMVAILALSQTDVVLLRLPALDSFSGLGIYYIFCSILGLAYGLRKDLTAEDIPFFVGMISLVVGIVCLSLHCCPCCCKRRKEEQTGRHSSRTVVVTKPNTANGSGSSSSNPDGSVGPTTAATPQASNDAPSAITIHGPNTTVPQVNYSSTSTGSRSNNNMVNYDSVSSTNGGSGGENVTPLKYKPDRWHEVSGLKNPLGRARVVMTWVNCIVLTLGGFYGSFGTVLGSMWGGGGGEGGSYNLHRVLSMYIMLFGLAALLYQMDIDSVTRHLGLLHSATSRGFFFLFVGLLGVVEGWGSASEAYADTVMLLVGLFSCVTGIVCVLSRTASATMAETTEDVKSSLVSSAAIAPNV